MVLRLRKRLSSLYLRRCALRSAFNTSGLDRRTRFASVYLSRMAFRASSSKFLYQDRDAWWKENNRVPMVPWNEHLRAPDILQAVESIVASYWVMVWQIVVRSMEETNVSGLRAMGCSPATLGASLFCRPLITTAILLLNNHLPSQCPPTTIRQKPKGPWMSLLHLPLAASSVAPDDYIVRRTLQILARLAAVVCAMDTSAPT
jgi:hypothetical protein